MAVITLMIHPSVTTCHVTVMAYSHVQFCQKTWWSDINIDSKSNKSGNAVKQRDFSSLVTSKTKYPALEELLMVSWLIATAHPN